MLSGVNRRLGRTEYQFQFLSAQPGLVRSSSGLSLQATHGLLHCRTRFHTLLIPGGEGTTERYGDAAFVRAVRRLSDQAERVVSVCTGSFLLAKAGLLTGKSCTSHWAFCERLAALHPEISVLSDPIFVHDGKIWTSAGVTAGLDLALALVEADLGAALAVELARWLVFYLRRPGGQNQYSLPLQVDTVQEDRMQRLLTLIREQPGKDWSIATLARQLHLSERQLSRLFQQRLRISPSAYVERARIESAQRLLCTTDWPLKRMASEVGYQNVATFLRGFVRITGITPARFRERFTPKKESSS